MNAKPRRYLVLLIISIAIRIFFYLFSFEAIFHGPVALTYFLHDGIFFVVLIKLLNFQKDRKWLIGLTWITLIASILYDSLACMGKKTSHFTAQQFDRAQFIIGGIFSIFYICLFLTKKGPARIFFRCMTVAVLLPFLYGIFAIVLHLPGPDSWIDNRAFATILSILLNLFLAFAVLRASRGRQEEYADFLK